MSNNLKDKSGDTVRIERPPPRVFTELSGRNVWMGGVEALELSLENSTSTDPYNSAEDIFRSRLVALVGQQK